MPAITGDMYINTHCNYSQPASIKLYNENIGGHLTPLHVWHEALTTLRRRQRYAVVNLKPK